MGIGNGARGGFALLIEGLITPHGDWEPVNQYVQGREWAKLITPHGDWEPETGAPERRQSMDSLPLMGIGNFQYELIEVQVIPLITPHGDWELEHLVDEDPLLYDSLPLMGIGNYTARMGP